MSTRRQLIVQAAALAAAPFISTSLTRALAAAAKKKLGFALCGLGSLSTFQIAPALQKTENCRLAGIITGTPAKARCGWAAMVCVWTRTTIFISRRPMAVSMPIRPWATAWS